MTGDERELWLSRSHHEAIEEIDRLQERAKSAEAQAAAMRTLLTERIVPLCAERRPWKRCRYHDQGKGDVEECRCEGRAITRVLFGDAGRALLAEVKRLRAVAEAAQELEDTRLCSQILRTALAALDKEVPRG